MRKAKRTVEGFIVEGEKWREVLEKWEDCKGTA